MTGMALQQYGIKATLMLLLIACTKFSDLAVRVFIAKISTRNLNLNWASVNKPHTSVFNCDFS